MDKLTSIGKIGHNHENWLIFTLLLVHSQADGTQVTSGGIEMQTFSVTKQVAIPYLLGLAHT